MKPDYEQTKQLLLDAGQRIMTVRGFLGVGLSEIVAAAGVPKGSFYHYFSSKEAFGSAVMERYFSDGIVFLTSVLSQPGFTPKQRLINLCEQWMKAQIGPDDEARSLLLRMCSEFHELSPEMKVCIRNGMDRLRAVMIACVGEGLDDGSIISKCPPPQLVDRLIHVWMGASVIGRITGTAESFASAMEHSRLVLKETKSSGF